MEIGEKVPKLKLVDTELKKVELSSAIEGKPAIIAFFPGAFTSVCTKEMCRFRDDMGQLNSLNGRVFAISVDGPFANREFKAKNGLNFDVLSDHKRKAAKAFHVEFKNFAHIRGYTAEKRSVFITDSNGVVRFKWVTEDPTVEPDYEAIKTALKEIK